MEKIIKGKTIVLGDNIDTDQIFPGRFLELTNPEDIEMNQEAKLL